MGRTMRTALAYTTARILMFLAALVLLYFAGARGLLLLGLALVISALASYILLNKQREVIAERLNRRLSRVGGKAAGSRERLQEGTAAEDVDDEDDYAAQEDRAGEPKSASRPASGA